MRRRSKTTDLKPFICIAIVMSFLFFSTFLKLENRKMSYSLFELAKKERLLREKKRNGVKTLVEITRPQRVRRLATNKWTFRAPKKGQIIHLAESGYAYIR